MLHFGDDPILEKLVGTIVRLLRHSEVDVRRVEVGLRLLVGIACVTRVELNEEIVGLHHRSRLHRHRDDLSRGFRLYFDDIYRLDHSGSLRRDHNRLAAYRLQWNRQCIVFLFRAGKGGQPGQREYYRAFQIFS